MVVLQLVSDWMDNW